MRREGSVISNIDWSTVLLYLLLILLGWINIYAAVYNENHQSIFDITQRYGKQLLWISLAIFLGVLVFILDARFYSFFAYLIYAATIATLIAVLIFGTEAHGARSWFQIGPFRLQPAEFAKFATSLALAKLLNTYNFKIHNIRNLITIGIIAFLPALLIILQNDTGSALVYVCFILVLYREGLSGIVLFIGLISAILFVLALLVNMTTVTILLLVAALLLFIFIHKNLRDAIITSILFVSAFGILILINRFLNLSVASHFLLFGALAFTGFVGIIWAYKEKLVYVFFILAFLVTALVFTYSVDYIFHDVLEKHQRTRINVLLGIEQDTKGAGYNVNQSKIAIGSGGLYGKGFLQGTQTKFNFVPEQSTDFIFCTVGEEWGFLGTATVISVFIVLLIRLIIIAERQRSIFSRVYGYCVFSILFFHFAINIGMTIGLAPVIGIPLPFFSYGGSSLWGFSILLFIFLRLDASRNELL